MLRGMGRTILIPGVALRSTLGYSHRATNVANLDRIAGANVNTVQIDVSRMIGSCCRVKDTLGAFTPLSGEAGNRPGVYAGLETPFDFIHSSSIV
jgi:hypothetical protein